MRILMVTLLATAVMSVMACTPAEPASETGMVEPTATEQAPTAQEDNPSAGDAASTPTPTQGIWFEPGSLSECGAGTDVVSVAWDVTGMSDAAAVRVLIPGDGSEELFAETGPQGSKETGPWMHAGSTMVVRDATTGAEIARATVGGIPCNQ